MTQGRPLGGAFGMCGRVGQAATPAFPLISGVHKSECPLGDAMKGGSIPGTWVRHLQNSWPTVEQASGFGCKLVTRAQGTGIEAPIHEETQARPGIGRGSGKSCRLLRVGSWVDRGHHVTDGYVTRRMSWSAVSASTPNMQWHITFAGPRTRTWRPPNSSLRRPLTRSTAVRSL